MGQGVVWYCGQFLSLQFFKGACAVDSQQAETWFGWAFILATPLFLVFASLSDKIGRKWIMMAGMLLSVLTTKALFQELKSISDPANKQEMVDQKVEKSATLKIDDTSKDTTYSIETIRTFTDGSVFTSKTDRLAPVDTTGKSAKMAPEVVSKTMKLGDSNMWSVIGVIFILMVYVTMVYGPIAAFLVELFPTRIRYTSMSLPYHIGNGVFGGLVPFVGALLVAYSVTPAMPSGDIYAGLSYPLGVAALCFIIGVVFLPNGATNTTHDD
jgi:hypothetical protein